MSEIELNKIKKYSFYDPHGENHMDIIGPIALIPMDNSRELTQEINDRLYERRAQYPSAEIHRQSVYFLQEDYRIDADYSRYSTGEGQVRLIDSVRGHDVFIICDVLNHACTYQLFGHTKFMSPDEHFQDLKRVILAISGKARRVNVIMPFLFDGRQHKRNGRESLDCAYILEELCNLGVSNIITFDAHDPRVSNSIPISGFENILPCYQIIKALKIYHPNLSLDNNDLTIISPDEGALPRTMYYANMLGCSLGTFYKRRDYTVVKNGRNPILKHEFLGESIEGKDVLIIDDMIASGDSMLDICREMKKLNAKRIYCAATFGLFTSGLEIFDEAYEEGIIDKVFTTNLIYRLPELSKAAWYHEVNMSKFTALIIDALNHDSSLSSICSPTNKIKSFLSKSKEVQNG